MITLLVPDIVFVEYRRYETLMECFNVDHIDSMHPEHHLSEPDLVNWVLSTAEYWAKNPDTQYYVVTCSHIVFDALRVAVKEGVIDTFKTIWRGDEVYKNKYFEWPVGFFDTTENLATRLLRR